ncbi:ShlB/FhaC/HecB family hemolysin secretion/activation protein [Paraburkholderia sp. J10-1]|uniref:ShlB/FhaC/HecB family hemolysin secretion/activation protein n=1 Tax=Paraburkholderia sp. J10-1 TaxID=2805430 RepID=UPI002AB7B285|nr:ShlB/FhaC/HecB family hemolysin secretion/activation protein [Paraburkholderia sp. J10-1]
MKVRNRLAAVPLIALVTLASNAQQLPTPADEAAAARANAEQQQQLQRQREAQERESAVSTPSVRSEVSKVETYPELPNETPCFRIDHFTLDVPATLPDAARAKGASALPLDPFAFARAWLDHYRGQCVGKTGLDVLTKGLQQAILSRGYVTTRVLVGQQDLSTGTLAFALVPGVVRQVRFADPATWGTVKTAFPVSGGDLLNLRDLEQGLEQMKRVSNQDADMQIVPADVPGVSDVVVTVKRSKPWTFVVSADNSGTDATGKWQGNASLGLNNPLGLNDILSLGANQDLSFGNKSLGSHGFNGSYSVPWGYWTATLSGNTNTYYQPIAGTGGQVFVSSGNQQTAALRIARVLARSQNDVLGAYVQLSKRFGQSFIEDTTIPIQNRNNTFFEMGATDRHYFGGAQFDGSLAYRQGIGGLGAKPDPVNDNGTPMAATYRFHMAVLDANLSVLGIALYGPKNAVDKAVKGLTLHR